MSIRDTFVVTEAMPGVFRLWVMFLFLGHWNIMLIIISFYCQDATLVDKASCYIKDLLM